MPVHFTTIKRPVLPLTNVAISEGQIKKELQTLKTDKAQGPDSLYPRILKELIDCLNKPLTLIFKKSLETGELPACWKTAEVTPIFKKGNRSDPGNYRPVSLTCILCKVLEKLVRDVLINHMTTNNLFSEYQHGFLKGRSCTTNLLFTLEELTKATDDGVPADVVYLDFAKAFDSVPHKRLISKLRSYQIEGKILTWIENFLTERRQRVVVGGKKSSWSSVSSGIPQGSVLGPILFVCFINDLPAEIQSQCAIFADDTKIFQRISTNEDNTVLQRDLDTLTAWSARWQLKFNEGKCKTLHIGKHNTEYKYKMANSILQKNRSRERPWRKHGCRIQIL